MKLSPHFSLAELTASETALRNGLDNTPSPEVIESLRALCLTILEPIRAHFGAVHVNSGYRSLEVNRRIGSKDTSQHTKGQAADIVVVGYKPIVVCEWIRDNGLFFDQCIHEFGTWTHVSYSPNNRGQCLTIDRLGTRIGLLEAR